MNNSTPLIVRANFIRPVTRKEIIINIIEYCNYDKMYGLWTITDGDIVLDDLNEFLMETIKYYNTVYSINSDPITLEEVNKYLILL